MFRLETSGVEVDQRQSSLDKLRLDIASRSKARNKVFHGMLVINAERASSLWRAASRGWTSTHDSQSKVSRIY